jgi:hypothetical protein
MFEKQIGQYMNQGQIPGLAVYSNGFGYRDTKNSD